MNKSYRLEVIERLTKQLETITTANKYSFDLSRKYEQHVFRDRAVYGDNDPLPMISIMEAAAQQSGPSAGEFQIYKHNSWLLVVQGWAMRVDGEEPCDSARALLADVTYCLGRVIATDRQGDPKYPDEYLLGRRDNGKPWITGLDIGAGVVRPPQNQVSSEAFFWLPLQLKIAETPGSPYVDAPEQENITN